MEGRFRKGWVRVATRPPCPAEAAVKLVFVRVGSGSFLSGSGPGCFCPGRVRVVSVRVGSGLFPVRVGSGLRAGVRPSPRRSPDLCSTFTMSNSAWTIAHRARFVAGGNLNSGVCRILRRREIAGSVRECGHSSAAAMTLCVVPGDDAPSQFRLLSNPRATTWAWISAAPSKMLRMRASQSTRLIGYSWA